MHPYETGGKDLLPDVLMARYADEPVEWVKKIYREWDYDFLVRIQPNNETPRGDYWQYVGGEWCYTVVYF